MEQIQTDRRKPSLQPERLIANALAASALAFGVYSAASNFLAGIQRDIDDIAREQAVLSDRINSYYRERDPWIKRIELLESRCSEVRERIGANK